MRALLIKNLLTVSGILLLIHCQHTQGQSTKINGVSLVNPSDSTSLAQLKTVSEIHATWVAIIPYAFSKQSEPQVHFNSPRQWWGERPKGTVKMINHAHQLNLKVMLKPHVWMSGGWIGEYTLTNEAHWLIWETEYEKYILTFAQIAQENEVALFCIGTEMRIVVQQRPQYWIALIRKIRNIYAGKITYAANWDDYHEVTFWDKLDYIGVNGYFPLTQSSSPSLSELNSAWKQPKQALIQLNEQYQCPILFTEYGYQSANAGAGAHWLVHTSESNVNLPLQSSAYQAFYETFWKESWVAGGFLWKWHLEGTHGGSKDPHFTPQNKPSSEVIKSWYLD